MAEQNSHHVVNQTLSGGDPSPSDVPASANDKIYAGGELGEAKDTISTTQTDPGLNAPRSDRKTDPSDSPLERNDVAQETARSSVVSFAEGCSCVTTE